METTRQKPILHSEREYPAFHAIGELEEELMEQIEENCSGRGRHSTIKRV